MLFRVFYMKKDSFREFSGDKTPDLAKLSETHAELRTVDAISLDQVFSQQQAHRWAEDWQACNALLDSKGLGHTSMSIGDVIENVASGEFFAVSFVGFTPLNPSPLGDRIRFRIHLSGDIVAAFPSLSAADSYVGTLTRDFDPDSILIATASEVIVENARKRIYAAMDGRT